MSVTSDEPEVPAPSAPGRRIPPIESRFLFVDVAALRAKQLRRGALPRLTQAVDDAAAKARTAGPHKLERLAMEEVRAGLIEYALPDLKAPAAAEEEEEA